MMALTGPSCVLQRSPAPPSGLGPVLRAGLAKNVTQSRLRGPSLVRKTEQVTNGPWCGGGEMKEGVSYRWAVPSKASTAGARGKGVQALPDLNKSGAGHTLAKLDAEVTGPQAPAGGQRTAERSLDNEGQPWRVRGGRKVFVLPHPSFLLALARHSSFSHWLTP